MTSRGRPGVGRISILGVAGVLVAGLAAIATAAPGAAAGEPVLSAVAVGWNHSCALTSAGGVKCWGYNAVCQLGDGTTTDRWTPVDVVGLGSDVTAITAGGNHTCALTTAGAVKCWGGNGFGGVGDGTTTDRWTPVDVVGLGKGVTAIAAGAFHTCAVASGGVKCWGDNEFGGLGDGTTLDRLTPTDVVGLASGFTGVAAGGRQSCALSVGGGVKCWGHNSFGEVGDGTGFMRLTPVDVVGLTSGASAITAGGRHSCALTSAGGIKCWGSDDYGQDGDGAGGTGVERFVPVNVVGLASGVSLVVTGRWHTCAVTTAGAVKCWGSPAGTGEIGDDRILTPVDVAGLGSGVASLSVGSGDGHTCARLSAGGAKCFGQNFYGELGNGTTTASPVPVDVLFGSGPPPPTTTTLPPTTTTVPPASPALTIANARVTEGNAGTTAEVFTVTLWPAATATVTVKATTANGTAVAPDDYGALTTSLSFAPGQTTATVTVGVRGETLREKNETFKVKLVRAVNATIADPTGVGTIVNDD